MGYKSKGSTFHENTFKQFMISTCLSSLWFLKIISLLLRFKQVVYIVCTHTCLDHLKQTRNERNMRFRSRGVSFLEKIHCDLETFYGFFSLFFSF
jgi:hypothetical protein